MRMIVNIDVPELARAIEFYTAALGLEHTRLLDDDVAELRKGPTVIYLLEQPAGSSPAPAAAPRKYERHWTPVHFDIVVDDVLEAAKRAIRAGAEQQSPCVEWRGSKCITFADPFGHGFCLIEFEDETYR